MKLLTTLSALFIIGGSLGWILELCYRRAAHGKWINPGFLTGPCLPLYGSGVLLLYGFCSLDLSFIKSDALRKIVLILILAVVLTGIEYVTGIVFTTVFHVKLWDYSSRPGNIQGIICPLFSLIWGLIGAAYALFIHPYLVSFIDWLSLNPIYNFFFGIYLGVLIVDVFYSFHLVRKIKAFADEQQLLVRYESLKLSIAERAEKIKAKRNFAFAFRSPVSLREEFESYLESLKEKGIKPLKIRKK